jgi:hypothetical protein
MAILPSNATERNPLNDADKAIGYGDIPGSAPGARGPEADRYHDIRKRVILRDTDYAVQQILGLQDTLYETLGKLAAEKARANHTEAGLHESLESELAAINHAAELLRSNRAWLLTVRRWQQAVKSGDLSDAIIESLEDAIDRAATAERERDQAKAAMLVMHTQLLDSESKLQRVTELEVTNAQLSQQAQLAQDDNLRLVPAGQVVLDLVIRDEHKTLTEAMQARVDEVYQGLRMERAVNDGQ